MLRGTCLFVFLYACGWVHFYLLRAFTFSWVVARAHTGIVYYYCCYRLVFLPAGPWLEGLYIYLF